MAYEIVISFLAWITLIGGILVALFIIYMILNVFIRNKFASKMKKFLKKRGMLIIFLISLIATLGSLFYSQILGLEPCRLCWYQRIFMYPLVIISGVGLFKKAKDVIYVILPMALIGGAISAYHYIVQFLPSLIVDCSLDGADCLVKQMFSFGYITIPMMAFTAFLAIFIVSLFNLKK